MTLEYKSWKDPEFHRHCIGGMCCECEGLGSSDCDHCGGDCDCRCSCGDEHDCGECDGSGKQDCGHCDGTGECTLGPTQQAYDDAKAALDEIKESVAPLKVSVKSFQFVFARMFGREATPTEVEGWIEQVRAVADVLGKRIEGVNAAEPTERTA